MLPTKQTLRKTRLKLSALARWAMPIASSILLAALAIGSIFTLLQAQRKCAASSTRCACVCDATLLSRSPSHGNCCSPKPCPCGHVQVQCVRLKLPLLRPGTRDGGSVSLGKRRRACVRLRAGAVDAKPLPRPLAGVPHDVHGAHQGHGRLAVAALFWPLLATRARRILCRTRLHGAHTRQPLRRARAAPHMLSALRCFLPSIVLS